MKQRVPVKFIGSGHSLNELVCTHGSGKTGTLSDFIVSIELIDGQGAYQYISRKHKPQWFNAACMNLGALG